MPSARAAPPRSRPTLAGTHAVVGDPIDLLRRARGDAGRARASPYGILDLAGNVWEWCEDAFDEAFYETGPAVNPKLVASADRKSTKESRPRYVVRGGSFVYDAGALRTYARMGFDPHDRFAEGGFRCAKTT